MKQEENVINVTVCGETFSLTSAKDEAYVRELAAYVDERLQEINRARGGGHMPVSLRNALLALNLADDYFREFDKNQRYTQTALQFPELDSQIIIDLKNKNEELAAELSKEKDKNASLEKKLRQMSEQVKSLKNDLNQATAMYKEKKKELEDYINEFEKKA